MIWPWNRKKRIQEFLDANAAIIDVRTVGEYASGHVAHSINIPLDQLTKSPKKPKADTKIITCCASGMRSGVAATQLKGMGYEAINGGSWFKLAQITDPSTD